MFPTISCAYRNIVNFSHTSQIHFSANNTSFRPFKRMRAQMPKNPRNSPFPLSLARGPHLIHQCLGPSHSPHQMTDRSLYALPHNYATKAPLVTMGCPKFTPKPAGPSLSTITPPSNTPILDRPHSPSQTASGSNQPFCHNTLRTERPTDQRTVQTNVPYHERSTRYADRATRQ